MKTTTSLKDRRGLVVLKMKCVARLIHMRAARSRLIFLVGAVIVLTFDSAMHWHFLIGNKWNLFAFLFIVCSMPWSGPWLGLPVAIRAEVPQYLRMDCDLLSVAVGFGLNCLLAYFIAAAAFALTKR